MSTFLPLKSSLQKRYNKDPDSFKKWADSLDVIFGEEDAVNFVNRVRDGKYIRRTRRKIPVKIEKTNSI